MSSFRLDWTERREQRCCRESWTASSSQDGALGVQLTVFESEQGGGLLLHSELRDEGSTEPFERHRWV